MDFSEILSKRRMVRHLTADPIDPSALQRVLSAALKAPSAGFTQGQSFVVITQPDMRKQISALLDEEAYSNGQYAFLSTAPALVIPCISEAAYHRRYQEPDKVLEDGSEEEWPYPFWHMDIGCAIMLLLLAVVNEGLAAAFVEVSVKNRQVLWDLLQIPEEVTPVGVIPIGHPGPYPPSPRLKSRRMPERERIHWESWGSSAQ
ncbi:nitroreductase family protein [Tengunoibacter tsumagoiensis]|uniref:Nitroreductase domain-containing protein n=1 Tax=Tengunoibacter tsumagoiensis TaxID=2014871 RepID=A0A401ZYL6_9CHLR|nr:nitroreductase family protein [Tengunoibacter tsumagoiensis]GCE11946.1 hypothetical protein KTT_18050 [Tengunoibacter tsumagoiensis]